MSELKRSFVFSKHLEEILKLSCMQLSRVPKSCLLFLFFRIICLNSAVGQIVNIEDKRSRFVDSIQWVEQLELGVNLTRNKTEIFSLNGKAQVEFAYFNKLLLSITHFNFIKAEGQSFINEGFQHLRYNSGINSWLTYELFGQVQYNERTNISIRALAGTGLRFLMFKKKEDKGYFGVTYMYEYEEESIDDLKHNNHRLSTYLAFSWHPRTNIKIASTSYYQPLFTDIHDFRLSSQTAAIFSFSKRLDFKMTYSVIYDTRAAVGAPEVTYKFLNSLRYRF